MFFENKKQFYEGEIFIDERKGCKNQQSLINNERPYRTDIAYCLHYLKETKSLKLNNPFPSEKAWKEVNKIYNRNSKNIQSVYNSITNNSTERLKETKIKPLNNTTWREYHRCPDWGMNPASRQRTGRESNRYPPRPQLDPSKARSATSTTPSPFKSSAARPVPAPPNPSAIISKSASLMIPSPFRSPAKRVISSRAWFVEAPCR